MNREKLARCANHEADIFWPWPRFSTASEGEIVVVVIIIILVVGAAAVRRRRVAAVQLDPVVLPVVKLRDGDCDGRYLRVGVWRL